MRNLKSKLVKRDKMPSIPFFKSQFFIFQNLKKYQFSSNSNNKLNEKFESGIKSNFNNNEFLKVHEKTDEISEENDKIKIRIKEIISCDDKEKKLYLKSRLNYQYFPTFYYDYSSYNKEKENALNEYYRIKFEKNKYKIFLKMFIGILIYSIYKLIKGYYILYYYIMYEIDIRKPKVSEYIVRRYR